MVCVWGQVLTGTVMMASVWGSDGNWDPHWVRVTAPLVNRGDGVMGFYPVQHWRLKDI